MEVIFIIIIVAFIWYAIKSSKSKNEVEIPVKFTVETSFRGGRYSDDRTVDTGKIKETAPGHYVINPKSPLPLTITGLSAVDVRDFKKKLDGEARWERNLSDLTFLIAQNNIQCIEVNEFISGLQQEVETHINQQIHNSSEWDIASEKDQADMLLEYRATAIENLSTHPSNEQALATLLYGEPHDDTADDELLSLFSGNVGLYRFYMMSLGRSSLKPVKVAADDYYRKQYEELVNLNFARRGKDIPLADMLEGLRMKDINEMFADRLEKKFGRKAQAVEYALSQPDAIDILGKHISFREMFQILEPENLDVAELKQCYEYAGALAEIIRDTYVTGYRTLDTLEDARDADYDGWEIEAEDCCRSCSKVNGKKTKRKPANLPPFHIGCTCSLEGVYDD